VSMLRTWMLVVLIGLMPADSITIDTTSSIEIVQPPQVIG
jgi:hypothetical protein